MFREGDEILYNSKGYSGRHDKYFSRTNKSENYDKEGLDIKKEINRCKNALFILRKKPNHKTYQKLSEDLEFWKNEMANKNYPSHKPLKSKTKKIKHDKLKTLVLEIIEEAIQADSWFVRKEDIAFRLNVKPKNLDVIFMELNREGILSQAQHRLMHDSNRGGFPLLPGESSDWAADIYYIRKKSSPN